MTSTPSAARRRALRHVAVTLAAGLAGDPLRAWAGASRQLDREQSRCFRDWLTLLIHEQVDHGPSPRWVHRDCAGLVRFAVDESLRVHDLDWRRANGLLGRRVPPDVALDDAARQRLRQAWRRADGSRGAFASAIDLVQGNTVFIGRTMTAALPGDLLFFDVGDEQHLMAWMGHYVAYHTGHVEPGDNGLRALRLEQLAAWPDTRWRPVADNPNFAGLYRLDFLAS